MLLHQFHDDLFQLLLGYIAFCKQLPGLYELTVASTRLWDQKVYELCRRNNIGGIFSTRTIDFFAGSD